MKDFATIYAAIFGVENWLLFQQAAQKAFPNENLTRSEIVRRYTLAGIDALKQLSASDRARLAHEYQASMEAPEERLKS
jgi:hypothetical protein